MKKSFTNLTAMQRYNIFSTVFKYIKKEILKITAKERN